ncbi:MAG: HD domain-containing protein [Bacteroidales bacterium]|nr:HD domain-containing protein [Bacteroidales bacterium]MDD4640388.1 HD domain-containing protein [Bacteroidales bacterium]
MNLSEHIKEPLFILLSEAAEEMNVRCCLVGGYVRDIFLKSSSQDIDIVTVGKGIELAEFVASKLGKSARVSVFKNFGTAQLRYGSLELEFVGARRESYQRESRKPVVEDGSLEDDLLRRDFTINAMAISLNKADYGDLIDPFDGRSDLRKKILRTPCDPDLTFSDDPLRMMRALRFATTLQFKIDPRTFEAIRRNRERISIVSAERISDEMQKMMMAEKPSEAFRLMDRSGLLELILPELAALKGVETKEGKGHKDNFLHTLLVLDKVAEQSKQLYLRWAALFHDIAKPLCKRWDEKLGWTFHNHNFLGEKKIPGIFRRLKLPMNEHMKYVQKLVGLHMRPVALIEEEVSDSAIRRLLFDAGDDIEDLMLLCEADITSKNPVKVQRYLENFQLVRQKMIDLEERDRIRNMQPPVSGEEIMATFGLAPCKLVGEIKNSIKEAILEGEIPNEYEAAKEYMLKIAGDLGLEAYKQEGSSS